MPKRNPISALFPLILCISAVLLYVNTFSHTFVFDDQSLIENNTFLSESLPIGTLFTTSYRAGAGHENDGLYRPLVITSFWFNSMAGKKPLYFHVANVLLYALVVAVVYFCIIATTGRRNLACVASLIYAFHPVHTEVVANCAGRSELLLALFVFAALTCWVTIRSSMLRAIAVALFFLTALLSKETAVVLPILILTVELIFRTPDDTSRISRLILLAVITAGVAGIYGILRFHALGALQIGIVPNFIDNPIAAEPWYVRIPAALRVFAAYMGRIMLPVTLSCDYSYNQLPVVQSFFHPLALVGGLFLAGGISLPMYLRKRHPALLFGAALFFLPYLVVSNIFFPIGTIMGERLMFLPSAGFALVLAYGLLQLGSRLSNTTVRLMLLVLLLFYGVRTVTRNTAWHDDWTLFTTDVEHSPRSVKILGNLGFYSKERGNPRAAAAYYSRALEIYPDYVYALRGLGKLLFENNQYQQALSCYERAVEREPDSSDLHYDYGAVLEKMGRIGEAQKQYQRAHVLSPDTPHPLRALGGVMMQKDRYDEAVGFYLEALDHGGDETILVRNLAVAYYYNGDYRQAMDYVTIARNKGIRLPVDFIQSLTEKLSDQP